MKKSNLILAGSAIALSAALVACGDFPVTMNYTLSEPVKMEMIAESYITTLDERVTNALVLIP